jgi:hypothetical protein
MAPKAARGENGKTMNGSPQPLLTDEVRRVVAALSDAEVSAQILGGLGVFLRCPSAATPPLAREYKDLDLVVSGSDGRRLAEVLTDAGYVGDEQFNLMHGHSRQLFWDEGNGRQLDVFVDEMEMCHKLDFRRSLESGPGVLPVADLILAKLQVVEINVKDLQDCVALLADHEIGPGALDPDRISALFANDWGWWRTGTENLRKVSSFAGELPGFSPDLVRARIDELLARIEAAPKTRRWKLRSRVGERKRWYELPEEVDG